MSHAPETHSNDEIYTPRFINKVKSGRRVRKAVLVFILTNQEIYSLKDGFGSVE